MTALQGSDPDSSISTFEFLTSGVVKRLKAYLQGAPGTFVKPKALSGAAAALTCAQPKQGRT